MAVLTVAVLLPLLLLVSWFLIRSYRETRSEINRQLLADAGMVARVVDSLIDRREALLRTLSTARGIEEGNLRDFHQRARRLVPGEDEWIVLMDSEGQQIVNTRFPFGTPLPSTNGRYLPTTNSGETYVSNLVRGPATGRDVLFVAVPVYLAGGATYTLHYAMTPKVLSDAVARTSIRASWIIAVIDREDRVIGRNRRIEDFLGSPATNGIREARATASSGALEDTSLEGSKSVVAYQVSNKSGWLVLVAAPTSEVFASAQQVLFAVSLAVVVTVVVALLLALWLGSGIVKAVGALVRSTEALGRGDAQGIVDTGMHETDHVVHAMQQAAAQLRARESELARSRDDAIAASRAKDEFLATLSHELRTPLNPVLMLASDAAADPSHSPEARAAFATIAKNVALEARLIDDMLDLTKIVRGKLSLDRKILDLHQVLRDSLNTVELEVAEKQLSLHTRLAAEKVFVLADPVRLQQVFWNLLKNAAKFTPASGRVEIETRLVESNVHIVVTDTGIGMTPEELERSFQSFSQGAHRLGGLGLGLSISRMLVELHGGSISAVSGGRGLGAAFTVRLPVVPAPAPRVTESRTPEPSLEEPGTPIAVLLVEDHETSRVILARLLRQRGYKVWAAGSMTEALRVFETEDIGLLVSDIGLPDGDGFSLVAKIHAVRPLPAIALSGYGMEDDVRRAREAGFSAHLVKPVTLEALQHALHRVRSSVDHTSEAP